jgi:hypothetical protein
MQLRWAVPALVGLWLLLRTPPVGAALPLYYGQVLSEAVGFHGGATPDPDGSYVLGSRAALALEQQLKRVIGADESKDLNMTQVRGLPDFELYRLLTLAALGNFTTARAPGWQQPVRVSVVPETGLFVVSGTGGSSDAALRVLLLIMCAVMFKRWMEDEAAAQAMEGQARRSQEDRPPEAKQD